MARAPYRQLIWSHSHTYAAISLYRTRTGFSVHGGAISYPGIRRAFGSLAEAMQAAWDYMVEYQLNYRYDLRHTPAAPMSREWFDAKILKEAGE